MASNEIEVAEVVTKFEQLTPLDILKVTDITILKSYAKHRKTPPDVLLVLSNHENSEVRLAVAKNASTPPEILNTLSSELYLTKYVAANTNTSPATLARIIALEDSSDYNGDYEQVTAALANPNTPLQTIVRFLLTHINTKFAISIESNSKFSEYLKHLTTGSDNTNGSYQKQETVEVTTKETKDQNQWK
ncbi:hypothetical protein AGMMS49983_07110 [Clostridia bacterium]|nr:hypothetical protein AGMMS49983_07110 [Clostridia bacterium]